MSGANEVYCGIDPGREKFGIAFADAHRLICAAIAPTPRFPLVADCMRSRNLLPLREWVTEGSVSEAPLAKTALKIFLGDGTFHYFFLATLTERQMPHILADERNTTLDARGLYWQLHPPTGLRKLIPVSLQVPPRPLDDLAAWAIIIRSFRDH